MAPKIPKLPNLGTGIDSRASKLARAFSGDSGLRVEVGDGLACRFYPDEHRITIPSHFDDFGIDTQKVFEGSVEHEVSHARTQKRIDDLRAEGKRIADPIRLAKPGTPRHKILNALADAHDEMNDPHAGSRDMLGDLRKWGTRRLASNPDKAQGLFGAACELYLRTMGVEHKVCNIGPKTNAAVTDCAKLARKVFKGGWSPDALARLLNPVAAKIAAALKEDEEEAEKKEAGDAGEPGEESEEGEEGEEGEETSDKSKDKPKDKPKEKGKDKDKPKDDDEEGEASAEEGDEEAEPEDDDSESGTEAEEDESGSSKSSGGKDKHDKDKPDDEEDTDIPVSSKSSEEIDSDLSEFDDPSAPEDFSAFVRDEVGHDAVKEAECKQLYIPSPQAVKQDRIEVPLIRESTRTAYRSISEAVSKVVGGLRNKLISVLIARRQGEAEYDREEGLLDRSALHTLARSSGTPRAFYREIPGDEDRPSVAILLDESGSMSWGMKIDVARKAVVAIAEALSALGVDFGCYGFTNVPTSGMGDSEEFFCGRTYAMRLQQYKGFEENWHTTKARIANATDLCENADGDAVLSVAKLLASRPATRRILVVLSDGMPCCPGGGESYSPSIESRHLKDVVKMVEDAGIEILGIGIQTSSVTKFYKNNAVVNDLDELPKVLFTIFSKMMLARNRQDRS